MCWFIILIRLLKTLAVQITNFITLVLWISMQMFLQSQKWDIQCVFKNRNIYAIYTAIVIKMKNKVVFWMSIMLIYFISTLSEYLNQINPISQQKSACIFDQKYDILSYFTRVPLCRGRNLYFRCQQFSGIFFLVIY